MFELDADTEIETRDHGVMTVAELERLLRKRRPHGLPRQGPTGTCVLRIAYSISKLGTL